MGGPSNARRFLVNSMDRRFPFDASQSSSTTTNFPTTTTATATTTTSSSQPAMDSETKEVKHDIAIKVEDTDQAVDVAQVAPAFQAEGSAQAGASTQENSHPPTLAEIQASKSYTRAATRYVFQQLTLTTRSDRISALRELPRQKHASSTVQPLQKRRPDMETVPSSYALLLFHISTIRTLTSYLCAM